MILVGNQRGNASDLARHLMKAENERVDIHQLRGFVAGDLNGAFHEAHAISRGTRCRQFLFSLSLNPPKDAEVSDAAFLAAINQAEERLGLTGQPRAIVFHEKRGTDGELRRHAHAVWSRIKADEMKAVQLSHSKTKLNALARDLYLEHGWQMPHGLVVSGGADPRNFSLADWQQAKRTGQDPRAVKAAFQDAWAISDTRAAFAHALQERGYWLCQGDRRGFVAVDVHGEVHSIARRVGLKAKGVRERLGDVNTLPSVADAKAEIAKAMKAKMAAFEAEVAEKDDADREQAEILQATLKKRHKGQKNAFEEAARLRHATEEAEREKRLRTGLWGLWDRVTGKRRKTLAENAKDAETARLRDEAERNKLASEQALQRNKIIEERVQRQQAFKALARSLKDDAKVFRDMETEAVRDRAAKDDPKPGNEQTRERSRRPRRGRSRDGPEP